MTRPGRSWRALPAVARALRRGGGNRWRSAWTSVALAGATAFGCAAVALGGMWLGDPAPDCTSSTITYADGSVATDTSCAPVIRGDEGLAPYLAEPGLRIGVLAGAVLLAVPFLLLVVQVQRFGSAARERRLAGLVLAGAGRRELRRIAATEAVRAALPGLLGGAALYLGLRWSYAATVVLVLGGPASGAAVPGAAAGLALTAVTTLLGTAAAGRLLRARLDATTAVDTLRTA